MDKETVGKENMSEPIPQTVEELEKWIAWHFECIDGPKRASFDIIDSQGRQASIIYQTLWLGMEGYGPVVDFELISSMHNLLKEALSKSLVFSEDHPPLLFWRRHLSIEVRPNSDNGAIGTDISCRLAISGYQFGEINHE